MRTWLRAAAAAVAGVALALPAAAQVTILTTGAYQDQTTRALQASGVTGTIVADTAGGGLRRLRSGERYDVVINTPATIDALIASGTLAPPRRDVARIGIGVAVAAGSPRPDVSNEDALRQTLLASPRIAMIDPAAGGSSGVALFKLFERWGVMEMLRPKLVLVQSGRAAGRLASGEATIALQQLTELNVPGADVVGPIPESVQVYTVYSVAARIDAGAEARAVLAVLPRAAP